MLVCSVINPVTDSSASFLACIISACWHIYMFTQFNLDEVYLICRVNRDGDIDERCSKSHLCVSAVYFNFSVTPALDIPVIKPLIHSVPNGQSVRHDSCQFLIDYVV